MSAHLPGIGPCDLTTGDDFDTEHRSLWVARALRSLFGRDESDSRWSLVPAPTNTGWSVLWHDIDAAHAARDGVVSVPGRPVSLRIGTGSPIVCPALRPGTHQLRVTTRTPLSVSRNVSGDDGAVIGRLRTRSLAGRSIAPSLAQLAARVGLEITSPLRADVVAESVYESRLPVAQKQGVPLWETGWSGTLYVVADGAARQLLEVAAAGYGLGRKAAFGCGAILVQAEGG